MPALLEPPSHACRDAVVRRHVDQAAASALATMTRRAVDVDGIIF